jgi:hypothetical protein
VSPAAAIASMTKWRGPLSTTLSAPKRFFIAASVILSQMSGGAIVQPERVVDGGDKVNAAAHHRDELAIARVAHAVDHVLGLVGRLGGGWGDDGGEYAGGNHYAAGHDGRRQAAPRAGPNCLAHPPTPVDSPVAADRSLKNRQSEAKPVARADGARVADDEAARALSTLADYSGKLGTSMYFDRLAGRTLEVEALTGAVVAAGARHRIATPLNRALLALLRAINDATGG